MNCLVWIFVDKLVPLPSLFFIGKNGAPIEIVTGVTKTIDELKSKIDIVLGTAKPTPTPTTTQSPAPSTASANASANFIASTNLITDISYRFE